MQYVFSVMNDLKANACNHSIANPNPNPLYLNLVLQIYLDTSIFPCCLKYIYFSFTR